MTDITTPPPAKPAGDAAKCEKLALDIICTDAPDWGSSEWNEAARELAEAVLVVLRAKPAGEPQSIAEPLRDQIGRVLFEEPPLQRDWYALSEERREPWRRDADRILALPALAALRATSPEKLCEHDWHDSHDYPTSFRCSKCGEYKHPTPSVPVLRSEAAEMAAFAASDAACYLYPGEHEQPLRVAYCEGAASMVEALQAAERERNAAVKDYGDNLVELAEAYHQLKAAAADNERLAAALRELQQRGKTRCNGYSRCCSEFYHAADVERVLALLPTPTPTVGSSPARRDGDG